MSIRGNSILLSVTVSLFAIHLPYSSSVRHKREWSSTNMQSSSLSPSRGFHTSLTTEIVLPNEPLSVSCSLHIFYQFPPDIIIDPYELENHEDIFSSSLAGHLNLELPVFAPDIGNTTLLVNVKHHPGSPGEAINITIPLHLRYGRPRICEDSQCGSESANITISPATVFQACLDHQPGPPPSEVLSLLASFPKSFAPTTTFILIPPPEDVVRSPPTIQIPVAQSQMTSTVELVTTFVILLAAFYLWWVSGRIVRTRTSRTTHSKAE